MAIGEITAKCAHCGKFFTVRKECGNRASADQWEEWATSTGYYDTCSECYKEFKAEEKELETEKALNETAQYHLPELTGSEKQIAWATKIRANLVNEFIERFRERCSFETLPADQREAYDQSVEICMNVFRKMTSSRNWIDIRDVDIVRWTFTEINKNAKEKGE